MSVTLFLILFVVIACVLMYWILPAWARKLELTAFWFTTAGLFIYLLIMGGLWSLFGNT